MNQTLPTTHGVGSLLNIGSVSTSTVAGAVSTVAGSNAGAVLPSFGDSLRQAQQGDGQALKGQTIASSPSGEQQVAAPPRSPQNSSVPPSDGQTLPGGGQLLPAGSDGTSESAAAPAVADNVAGSTAEAAAPVDRSKLQQLEERLKQQSARDSEDGQASDDAGSDALKQIDQYRRADLAVAVDSALQQFSGGVRSGDSSAVDSRRAGVTTATTVAAAPSAEYSRESQWLSSARSVLNSQSSQTAAQGASTVAGQPSIPQGEVSFVAPAAEQARPGVTGQNSPVSNADAGVAVQTATPAQLTTTEQNSPVASADMRVASQAAAQVPSTPAGQNPPVVSADMRSASQANAQTPSAPAGQSSPVVSADMRPASQATAQTPSTPAGQNSPVASSDMRPASQTAGQTPSIPAEQNPPVASADMRPASQTAGQAPSIAAEPNPPVAPADVRPASQTAGQTPSTPAGQNPPVAPADMRPASQAVGQTPSIPAEQNSPVASADMKPASRTVGQAPSIPTEQNPPVTSADMRSASQAVGQADLMRSGQNAPAADVSMPAFRAKGRSGAGLNGAAVDKSVANGSVDKAEASKTGGDGRAVSGAGQTPVNSLSVNSTLAQPDSQPTAPPVMPGPVVSNTQDEAEAPQPDIRQREAVAAHNQQAGTVNPSVSSVPPVPDEVAAQAAVFVQGAVKGAEQNPESVSPPRADGYQRVSLDGVATQAQQDSAGQQSARQQNDVLVAQAPSQSQPVTAQPASQSQTAPGQPVPHPQVEAQLSADSLREKLKASAAEGDKSSGSIESASRTEARQESLLTSFADSLAAASRAARPMQDASQLVMPHGLRPGEQAWSQAVNDRVMLMASKNGQFADIQLDPPELGSLQVRLHLKNDQISVVFNTPHGTVREALEQNMPRLREMFADQGLNLSDSSVEDQSRGQQRDGSDPDSRSPFVGYQNDAVVDAGREEMVQGESLSLVDYYA